VWWRVFLEARIVIKRMPKNNYDDKNDPQEGATNCYIAGVVHRSSHIARRKDRSRDGQSDTSCLLSEKRHWLDYSLG
jgi:hypothetical protein